MSEQRALRTWLIAGLTLMALCAFATLQVFVGVTIRYLLDFLPLTLPLASLGFWVVLEQTQAKPTARLVLHLIVGGLFVYSLVVGVLLGATGYYDPRSW